MKRLVPLLALLVVACGWPRGEKKRLIAACEESGRSREACECRYAELERTKKWSDYEMLLERGGVPLLTTDLSADAACAGKKIEEFVNEVTGEGKPAE